MKNPYLILGVSQNANKTEIVKGQVNAMKAKIYSPREITIAQKQLSTPYKRLAVDFTSPIFESEELTEVGSKIKIEKIDIEQIESNIFDSLK